MSMMRPVGLYALTVKPGEELGDACNDPRFLNCGFRVTMASINPNDKPEDPDAPLHSTLILVQDLNEDSDSEGDSDDSDYEDELREMGLSLGDSDGSDDDMVNGGPSDPEKVNKAKREALLKAIKDDEEMEELENVVNGVNGTKIDKGKAKAVEYDEEPYELVETVICTLDPKNHCQQALDLYVDPRELCAFKTVGAFTIHLTGNFVIPPEEIEDGDSSDDEAGMGALAMDGYEDLTDSDEDEDEESEEDELDDIADPRIMEIDSDEEEVPALVKSTKVEVKKKKKRGAEDSTEDEITTEAVLAQVLKPSDKADKHQAKKLKNNSGQAVSASKTEKNQEAKDAAAKAENVKKSALKKDAQNPSEKKVQFSKQLEQGPASSKANEKATPSSRVVQGVTIDDRKAGSGPDAKNGDKLSLRYIGKLKDGKQFDANKKGPPFKLTLGKGEVIRGWEIGLQGMKVGGERRITIPAKLAYGKKGMPGIPPNSDLVFDLKLIANN